MTLIFNIGPDLKYATKEVICLNEVSISHTVCSTCSWAMGRGQGHDGFWSESRERRSTEIGLAFTERLMSTGRQTVGTAKGDSEERGFSPVWIPRGSWEKQGVLYCKEAGLVYLCPMLWDRVWETAYVWPGQESFFIGWGCSLNVVNQLLCVEGARHVCPAPNHLWLEPKGTSTLAGLSLHALFVAKKKKQSFDVYE